MDLEYNNIKVGKLKLKGEKHSSKKKSKKRSHDAVEKLSLFDIDSEKHGGWRKLLLLSEITGPVAIQLNEKPFYFRALDNGLFTVGAPHNEGEGPAPEEIFTAFPAGESTIALKSGYSKYLGVDSKNRVIGRADAIGARELWQPIFQDGKTALLAANECFISVDDEDNLVAFKSKAGEEEMVSIRTNVKKSDDKTKEIPVEEQGKLKDVEKKYVKQFQKFQDKKIKINQGSRSDLREAHKEGRLHETLLDRRSKMKADRYCK